MLLTRQPAVSPPELDSIGSPGVLQLTWLMGRASHIAEDLAKVDDPSSDKLLRAGKEIDVRMREHIEKKDEQCKRTSAPAGLGDMPELTAGNGPASPGVEKANDLNSPGSERTMDMV